jgi:hypothetical protein
MRLILIDLFVVCSRKLNAVKMKRFIDACVRVGLQEHTSIVVRHHHVRQQVSGITRLWFSRYSALMQ